MKNGKDSLIKLLYECAAACHRCSAECLAHDASMMSDCIKTDMDCADICTMTATFLARNSKHGNHLLAECIEICTACAKECEKHDQQHCRDCAEICRLCIAACTEFKAA